MNQELKFNSIVQTIEFHTEKTVHDSEIVGWSPFFNMCLCLQTRDVLRSLIHDVKKNIKLDDLDPFNL